MNNQIVSQKIHTTPADNLELSDNILTYRRSSNCVKKYTNTKLPDNLESKDNIFTRARVHLSGITGKHCMLID